MKGTDNSTTRTFFRVNKPFYTPGNIHNLHPTTLVVAARSIRDSLHVRSAGSNGKRKGGGHAKAEYLAI